MSVISTRKAVIASIRRHDLLRPGERVLVAVSGGPDSVALLHLLCELKDELQLHLEVAHLQHGIRGLDAKEDARFVAALAEKLKLPFHLREIDLPRLKSEAGGNLEALGRAERYRFFAETITARNLSKVATAHTQEDQVETVLMWFLRGAGMKGLGGMAPRQRIRMPGNDQPDPMIVIRPLIDVSKSAVVAYLEERNLAYRTDLTNQDPRFLRNWLRSELVPKIQARVGAGFSARLTRQAELLRNEHAYLDGLARRRYDAVRSGKNLHRKPLMGEPKALQRRILRHWIEKTRGHLRGLDFVHVEELLRLIEEGPVQARLPIPGGWEFVREYEDLRLEKRSIGMKRVCYSYNFEIGMPIEICEAGLQLCSQRLSLSEARLPADMSEAVFDIDCLTAPLMVRNFRHGDRFQPLGMAGHKKIKDLFIENKVPLSIRPRWPLLTMAKEILWIPGYGRSNTALVSEKTVAVLRINAFPIGT